MGTSIDDHEGRMTLTMLWSCGVNADSVKRESPDFRRSAAMNFFLVCSLAIRVDQQNWVLRVNEVRWSVLQVAV